MRRTSPAREAVAAAAFQVAAGLWVEAAVGWAVWEERVVGPRVAAETQAAMVRWVVGSEVRERAASSVATATLEAQMVVAV